MSPTLVYILQSAEAVAAGLLIGVLTVKLWELMDGYRVR